MKYDGTVRNSSGDVIQFVYGEDGMDATYIEHQRLDFIRWGNAEMEKNFFYSNTECEALHPATMEPPLPGDNSYWEKLKEEYATLCNYRGNSIRREDFKIYEG